MKKEEIILAFLKRGFQLHPKAVELLMEHEEKVGELISKLSSLKPKPLIVTPEMVKKFLVGGLARKEVKGSVEVIKEFKVEKEKRSVNDVLSYLLDRYEKMKKILMRRLDLVNLVSINKLTSRTQRFSIIGMVREKNQNTKGLVVEDPTGELTLLAEERIFDAVILDDVLGFKCERSGGNLIVKDIVWPDVPLLHPVNRSKDDIQALFVSSILSEPSFKKDSYKRFVEWVNSLDNLTYLFILGGVSDPRVFEDLKGKYTVILCNTSEKLEGVVQVSTPALVKIHGSIKVLIIGGKFLEKYKNIFGSDDPLDILNALLKRRHLNPVVDLTNLPKKDIFVLETIPDIIVTGNSHKPGFKNYKGVTLISCGSFVTDSTCFLVNLKTREVTTKKF